jgi:hypothetical protein
LSSADRSKFGDEIIAREKKRQEKSRNSEVGSLNLERRGKTQATPTRMKRQ